MEKGDPDFREAERLFSGAIRFRHPATMDETLFYEWSRALCRIMLLSPVGTTEAEAAEIIADLKIAVRNENLRRRTRGDQGSSVRDIDQKIPEWLDATGRRFELFDSIAD